MRVRIFETTIAHLLERDINHFLEISSDITELVDIKYVACTPGDEDGSRELYSAMIIYK